MTRLNRKKLQASLLITLWAVAMVVAYWWYEARYLRSFIAQNVLFDGEQLRLPDELAGPGPIRLVHFWDPSCPCSVASQQHLIALIERYSQQGVSFYVVQAPGSQGHLPEAMAILQTIATLSGSDKIPSSPAVAIWDRSGKLSYFGPYSEGASCTSSNSFIEPILDALSSGRTVNASNMLAVSCFCDWPQD
ncbi:DUF6436 domain-containing protein [Pseudomonas violetae]|uniref:DUF6436 domain-containing protein n=1 Tax=Pseudomonas violetae TaxID=2915813 RepID=A0ABT0F138_9PSED|nr:DUF6436 domain-containing protein [Pseudomonas violetae]MCK1791715.1 DUF6436 domain-containing protein [Pseudomonas violetae]